MHFGLETRNNVSCYNKDSSKKRHTKKNDFIEYCANANGGILHTIEQLTMNIDSLKESCDFIYKKYVIGSDDITLSNKKITNLDVFKFFSSRNLILNNNDIKDITPLGKMESLGNLVLDNNPVSDISPLKNKNSNLHRLSIINTKIVDLKSLSNPKSLKKIWISNIKSLKSIKAFINLKELSIVNSELIDLTEIKEFKNLKKLIVKNAPLVDISPISSLTKLDDIELTDVSVSDISPVKSLKYLKLLLKNTKIDDLSSLSGKIIFLNTYGNKLKWCSPKNRKDFREKVSCYNKDGSEKVKPKK